MENIESWGRLPLPPPGKVNKAQNLRKTFLIQPFCLEEDLETWSIKANKFQIQHPFYRVYRQTALTPIHVANLHMLYSTLWNYKQEVN